jgi:succinate dehydrogenase / fumarate reductase cytochrome b subunit
VVHIRTTLTGYTRYQGHAGQWSFLLHRLTGLGTLVFLAVHILDTALVYFRPELYIKVIEIYRTTLFGLAEIALVFCVLFHGVNGLRLAVTDLFAPKGWNRFSQHWITRLTLTAALILWIPAAVIMLRDLLIHNFGWFGG